MKEKVVLSIIGSGMLLLASFSTIVKVPVLSGAMGYIYPGGGSVLIVLILGIISFIFSLKKNYKILLFVGITGIVVMIILGIYANTSLSKVRYMYEQKYLSDSPFPEGFDTLIMKPAEFQFGSVLLIVGSILLIISYYIDRKER